VPNDITFNVVGSFSSQLLNIGSNAWCYTWWWHRHTCTVRSGDIISGYFTFITGEAHCTILHSLAIIQVTIYSFT